MEYAIAVFGLGFMVTIVVAKGMLMANDYANSERESQDAPKQTDIAEL